MMRSVLNDGQREAALAMLRAGAIGLSQRETDAYSVCRALRAIAVDPAGDLRPALRRDAPLEAEAHEAIAQRVGRAAAPGCIFVPVEIQHRGGVDRRDLGVASAGYLTETRLGPAETFIGHAYAADITKRLGVVHVPLEGGAAMFPRVTQGVSTYWVADGVPITEGQATFGQAVAEPKLVGAYTQISRTLLLQTSPAAERFIFADAGAAVGAAVAKAVIAGSGARGQPLGIMNTAGINTASGATLDWDPAITEMVGAASAANGVRDPAARGWAGSPDVELLLRRRERFPGGGVPVWNDDAIIGPALASTAVPSATLLYGDWSAVMVVDWGVLEIGVSPFNATGFRAGLLDARALWTCDVVVRYPGAFSVATSAT